MSGMLCALCAKPAAPGDPLAWDDAGRLVHQDSDCDEPAKDFEKCLNCSLAFRAGTLLHAELHARWVETEAGRDRKDSLRPFGSDRPFYLRLRRFEDTPGPLPAGTQGLIVETVGGSDGQPWLVCQACAADGQEWRRFRGWAQGPRADAQPATDEGLAAMVPADGPGLRITDFAGLWAMGQITAKSRARELARGGLLRVEERKTAAGGSSVKLYWRAS